MTALPPTGSKPRELLLISTDYFDLSIKGNPVNEKVQAFQLHQDKEGKRRQALLEVYSTWLPSQVFVYDPDSLDGSVEHTGGKIYPCFFEQNSYELIIVKKQACPEDLHLDHINRRLREAVTATAQGNVLSGVINFGDEIGFSRFEVKGGEKSYLSFEIEVFPEKLDYQEDFSQLLQEASEEVYNLAFDFLMRTHLKASLLRGEEPSPAEFFSILQVLFNKLIQALQLIANNPHQKIVPLNRVVRPEKVKKADVYTAKWLNRRPHLLEKASAGIQIGKDRYLPRKVLERKKERTFDTYENRFLKWALNRILRNLRDFQQRYINCCGHNPDLKLLNTIDKMEKQLKSFLSCSFLQEAGNIKRINISSLVIQMAPGYREVLKYHLMLLKGLNVQADLFNISLKNMAELYEYWCFLKLNSIMRSKYYLAQNGLLAVDREGITVRLKKGKESAMQYVNQENEERFSIIYNRSFINLPTTAQKPDNVLILEKKGSNTRFHYVFDAKYRLTVEENYIRHYNQPGPPEDTINAMHRYRDAILSSSGVYNSPYRTVFGAFVLFPHNDEWSFAGKNGSLPSRFFKSIEEAGIGALPFLPAQTKLVENLLDDLFYETPETAFERTAVQEGTKEYFVSEAERRNVLIGPLGRKEQLQVCLDKGIYYTYLDQVQSYLSDLEYVAIYQSKRMFKDPDQQGIFWYGKIRSFTICKRKDIKEISPRKGRNGEELAVKFFMESWQQKYPPVKAAGYGPARPQRTRWGVFQESNIYPELHLNSLEIRLWRELKRLNVCLEISFPEENIDSSDNAERLIFPGLELIRQGANMFLARVNGREKIYSFDVLQRKPGCTLRDIIRFWRKQ